MIDAAMKKGQALAIAITVLWQQVNETSNLVQRARLLAVINELQELQVEISYQKRKKI